VYKGIVCIYFADNVFLRNNKPSAKQVDNASNPLVYANVSVSSASHHVLSITIPVDHTSMRLEEINEYRRLRQAEADMNLEAYVLMAKSTREDLEVHFLASIALF
jgi:hypothetical protein